MKLITYSIIILIATSIMSCETSTNENIKSEEKKKDIVEVELPGAKEDQKLAVSEEIPEEVIEVEEDYTKDELMNPNLHYYEGQIGSHKIELILKEDYSNLYGRYIYVNNGSSFPLKVTQINSNTIELKRMKNDKVHELFKGVYSPDLSHIEGVWIKNDKELPFELNEIVASSESVSLFIDKGEADNLYNSNNGVKIIKDYVSGDVYFNSFFTEESMGSGTDFGYNSSEDYECMFETETEKVYINCIISNTMSTVFEEGHEPLDAMDENYIAVGEERIAEVEFNYKVVQNGETTEKEIEFSEEDNLSMWFFRDYILFEIENPYSEKDESIVYKWNSELEVYQKID